MAVPNLSSMMADSMLDILAGAVPARRGPSNVCDCPSCRLVRDSAAVSLPFPLGPVPVLSTDPVPSAPGAKPSLWDLCQQLERKSFRDLDEEREALLGLIAKADAREKRDTEERERKRAHYRETNGGSPIELLPPEVLAVVFNHVFNDLWATAGAGRKKYTIEQKRKDAVPRMRQLSLVCPAFLQVLRPRLFRHVNLPTRPAEVSESFLQVWPTFSASCRRIFGDLQAAPFIAQAPNLTSLSLGGPIWKADPEAVEKYLAALEQPRPELKLLSIFVSNSSTVPPDAIISSAEEGDEPSLTLAPHIFNLLGNLGTVSLRLHLGWELWSSLLDHISVLQHLKVLALNGGSLQGTFLPLEGKPLKSLTTLRFSNMNEAENFLPGLLRRAPGLERISFTNCSHFECNRCFSGRLAEQEKAVAAAKEAEWEDIDDSEPEPKATAFLELSGALTDYPVVPQSKPFVRPGRRIKEPLTEAQKHTPRAEAIFATMQSTELNRLKFLTMTDCIGWNAMVSHFVDTNLQSVMIKAHKSAIDDMDLDPSDLASFFETLPSLKLIKLPMSPDFDYDDRDEDEEDEIAGRRDQWDEGIWTLQSQLPRDVKLNQEDELELSEPFIF